MLLRHPLGRQRRVGGPKWAERRLFDQVRADDPECVLLQQALREVRHECCDVPSACQFLEDLSRWALHWRWLSEVSPFVEGWTQVAAGPAEPMEDSAAALERLHALVTEARETNPG
jgi:Lhr-like helicase